MPYRMPKTQRMVRKQLRSPHSAQQYLWSECCEEPDAFLQNPVLPMLLLENPRWEIKVKEAQRALSMRKYLRKYPIEQRYSEELEYFSQSRAWEIDDGRSTWDGFQYSGSGALFKTAYARQDTKYGFTDQDARFQVNTHFEDLDCDRSTWIYAAVHRRNPSVHSAQWVMDEGPGYLRIRSEDSPTPFRSSCGDF